jgi:hypothetical protein
MEEDQAGKSAPEGKGAIPHLISKESLQDGHAGLVTACQTSDPNYAPKQTEAQRKSVNKKKAQGGRQPFDSTDTTYSMNDTSILKERYVCARTRHGNTEGR